MEPSENRKGLTIGAMEIQDSERPRTYKYKVVMLQLAKRHNLLSGHLLFSIQGRELGQEVIYPLKDLSTEYDQEKIKLRFKYFQAIAGELVLPEGFEPEGIELVARSQAKKGKTPVEIRKKFGWLVQETL